MTEKTQGVVYKRFVKYGQMQSTTGTRATTEGMTIIFSYTVEGKIYVHQQALTYSVIDGQGLNRIYISKLPLRIKVKYNKYNPYEAAVDLE
jgi:hypothetical protein